MLQCGCKEIAKYVRYFKKETVMIGSLIVGALIGMMAGAIKMCIRDRARRSLSV